MCSPRRILGSFRASGKVLFLASIRESPIGALETVQPVNVERSWRDGAKKVKEKKKKKKKKVIGESTAHGSMHFSHQASVGFHSENGVKPLRPLTARGKL